MVLSLFFIIMKEKIIKTDKATLLVVELPGTVEVSDIRSIEAMHSCKIVNRIPDITEEDAKLVVDNYSDSKYKNYSENQQDYPYFENPKYSLYSLIESKGIDINNGNLYLFKKV